MFLQAGVTLPNWATVLEVHRIHDDEAVVLAKRFNGEYVTWVMNPAEPESTTLGHYYPSIAEAAFDFERRAGISETTDNDEGEQ